MNQEIDKSLFNNLAQIIEQGKQQVVAQVNSVLTLTYWHVGKKINEHVLENKRAAYGKEIISELAAQLKVSYGSQYAEKNLRRMMRLQKSFQIPRLSHHWCDN